MGRKIYIDELIEYFLQQNCVLLEDEFINAKTKMRYICHCGREDFKTWSDFKSGRRCMKCANEKTSKRHITPFSEVVELFNSFGYEVTERYRDNNGKIQYKYLCPKGHKGHTHYHMFKSGTRCRKCRAEENAERYRMSTDVVEGILREQGCELFGEYINSDTPFLYKCSCGNVSTGYLFAIKKGIKCGCGYKSGEEHSNWNPDISQEDREQMRKYPEYHQWVQDVYERDDYTCQCCLQRGVSLHAHHIYNYSQHKELRTELSNGITLCETCHKDFHNTYGYLDNDEYQLNEYIEEIQNEIISLTT